MSQHSIAATHAPHGRPAAVPTPLRQAPRRRRVLIGLAFAALVGAVGSFALRSRETTRIVELQLGDIALHVPASLIRPGPQHQGGALSRLDLALDIADFTPAKPRAESIDGVGAGLGDVLLVAITQPDDIGDPAGRLSDLHGRFLEPDLNTGPAGLMMRRFRPQSPYAGEKLLFAPPDGRLFWARCPAADEARNGPVAQVCLTELRRHGLDVQVRFDPRQLDRWADFETRLTALLAALRGQS